MEGLVPGPALVPKPVIWPRNEMNLSHRWLVFMFFWAVLIGAITCLSVAALGNI